VIAVGINRATRERQAGPCGVAERSVVPFLMWLTLWKAESLYIARSKVRIGAEWDDEPLASVERCYGRG
jgi:hypothetical protein